MYPHMIEVHTTGYPISVNIDHIAMIGEEVIQMDCITCDSDNRTFYEVDESYEDLKALIHDAGCIIAKKDPRLDDSPLTMEQLKKMIGEPVWDSNDRCWMLVGEDRGDAVYMVYNAGNGSDWDEVMLTHYPLYRMKVTE